jgi:hypothetical protein
MNKLAYNIDLKIGDVILTGKWKNVREVVEKFGTNDVGQPTVNGKSLLNLRIEKLLPNSKKSSETLAAELDKVKTAAFYDELNKLASLFHFKKNKKKYRINTDYETDDVVDILEDDIDKYSTLKEGITYPSKAAKKEYDAANDSETEDLDAATNYSPKYPTDHLAIKTAGEKFIVQYLVGKNIDGRVRRIPIHKAEQTQSTGYRPPLGDISHGDGTVRSYDYGASS